MEEDAVVFYIELSISIFSLFFCVPLYFRKQCLKTIAQQNLQSYSKKYKNYRILLQALNILAYIYLAVMQLFIIPILIMFNYEKQQIFAIIWVFPIIAGIMQIYIEEKEFNSKIPLMIYHKIYWIGQMILSLIIFAYLLATKSQKLDQDELIRFFSFTGRALIQICISIYICIRRQDIQEFMGLSLIVWDLEVNQIQTPLIQSPSQMVFDDNSDQGSSDNEIEVIVLPGFTTQHSSLQFKIRVILNPRRTISDSNNINQLYGITNSQKDKTITKEYSEFIQLQEDLNEEIQRDKAVTDSTIEDINKINLLCTNNISLEYSQVESLSSKLKEFMKFVCKNPNFYYPCFLEFIKISEMDLKQYYLELKQNNPNRQDLLERQNQRLESANNQTQSFYVDFKNQEYFEVILDKSEEKNIEYVKYQIKITNLSNKCYIKLQMRYSELRQMHQALKQHFKNMPKFPSKIIKINSSALQERMNQLRLFLCILLNEDEYHRDNMLFNQLNPYITKQVGSKVWHIETVQLYRCNYNQWMAESSGFFIQMTEKESKGYTVYRFTIFENESRRGQIEKRFNEFVKLHEFIEHKFSHIVDNLPSLPPKISNLNTNIPKNKRQLDLQDYMNKLFRIKNIDSCYFFRQFFSIVSQPSELLSVSQSPQFLPSNNQEQASEIMDDVIDLRYQLDTSNQAENHLNSVQINELQQYAGQIGPSTN
ncbi:hypothetical protein ABPG72_022164 [Tetrahymena utriculariae]